MKAEKFTHEACSKCGTPRTVLNGAWLRERRIKAGYTLRDFAKRVGKSAPYISDIERNRRNCLPAMRDAYENIASFEKS